MPITETIDGQARTVDTLTMSGLGRLQKFLDRQPYPKDLPAIVAEIEALRVAGVHTDEEALAAKREAKAEWFTWPPEIIFDPRARVLFMYDDAGRAELLRAALRPEPSPEEAASMARSVSISQFMRIYAAAFAIDDEEPADPKGGATTDAPAPA